MRVFIPVFSVLGIISQAISSFYLIFVLSKRTDNCKLDLRKLQFNKTELKEIIRIGLPAGIQSSLFSISNVFIQSSVNSFGDVFVSGNAAASNIDSFIYVATNSFYQTSINFIGQNSAARKYDRVKKIFLTCLCCTVVSGIVLGLGAYLFGHELLSLYITDSEQAIQYGFIRLSIMCRIKSRTGTLLKAV